MSFIQEDDPWVLAYFRQNELRYVEPGNEAEIFLKTYPDRIIKCKVDSILWSTAQGQMPISGNSANHDARGCARSAHRGPAPRRTEGQGYFPRRRRDGRRRDLHREGQDHPHHPQGLRARLDEDRLVRLQAPLSPVSHEYPHSSRHRSRASRSPVARSKIHPPAPTSCPMRRARKIPGKWAGPHRCGDVVPNWIRTFGDPELTALVADAVERNPDLRAAAARVEASRAAVARRRVGALPADRDEGTRRTAGT